LSPEAPEFKPSFKPNLAAKEFVPGLSKLSSDAPAFVPKGGKMAEAANGNGEAATESVPGKMLSSDAKPFVPQTEATNGDSAAADAKQAATKALSGDAKPFVPSAPDLPAEPQDAGEDPQAADFDPGFGAGAEYVDYPAAAPLPQPLDIEVAYLEEQNCAAAFKEVMKAAFEHVPGIMMSVKFNGPYNILFKMRFPHVGHLMAAARKVAAKHTYTGGDRPIFVLEAETITEQDHLDAARGLMKQTVELQVFYLAEVGTDVCWALVKNGACIRGDLCPWVHVPMIGIRVVLEAEGSELDFQLGAPVGGKGPLRRGKKGLGLGKGGDNGIGKGIGSLGKGGDGGGSKDAQAVQVVNGNPGRYLMDTLKSAADFPEVSEVNGAKKAKEGRSGRRGRGRTPGESAQPGATSSSTK
jgi:hypothetical protein